MTFRKYFELHNNKFQGVEDNRKIFMRIMKIMMPNPYKNSIRNKRIESH